MTAPKRSKRTVAPRKLNANELQKRREARAFVEAFDAINRLEWNGERRRVLRSLLDALDVTLASLTRVQ